ncbi:tRNA (N6-isopentenyl adenosine(37)-C2)-methylthiotransferase MiaB [Chloroflexota bacterium]
MNYYMWTIGCQMNVADSRNLADGLERLGYEAAAKAEDADIIVLNSCVVRQSAENRVASKLGALRGIKKLRPEATVALMGCMVGAEVYELHERFPPVDMFMSPQQFKPLLDIAEKRMSRAADFEYTASAMPPTAYVPIIHGCDNFCTYCVVPYRRGREISRSIADIVDEVESLVARGAKEVTLLGQNVDSYGHDLSDKPDLADLLETLNDVDGLLRIRFLTSHPKDMSGRLIEAVGKLDKVCEHISLPFQAGDNDILVAMHRGYTIDQYRALVERIRNVIPNAAISTDLIVGFPGETDAQFEQSYALLRDVKFDMVHVAMYSPRPETYASQHLTDDVPPDVKKERLDRVEVLQEKVVTEVNARLLGTTVEVLVEGTKKGRWFGRTRTDKLVFFDDERDLLGQIAKIEVKKTGAWSLQGTAI